MNDPRPDPPPPPSAGPAAGSSSSSSSSSSPSSSSSSSSPSAAAAAAAAATGAIVLKKYGNRRLYDTSTSRYVTLVEVEAMVQRGADIVVLDARTGDDITKEVLVQLLLERDEARAALPVGLLKQAVKLAGTPLKDSLARVMQEGLDTFLGSQRAVLDAQRAFSAQVAQMAQLAPSMAPSLASSVASSMTPLAGAAWPGAMASLWNPFSALTPPPARAGDVASANMSPVSPSQAQQQQAPSPAASQAQQLDALKAELSETQALVRRLVERDLQHADRAPRGRKAAATKPKTKTTKTTKATKTRKR